MAPFAIDFRREKAGFSDGLRKLALLYALGRGLGWDYAGALFFLRRLYPLTKRHRLIRKLLGDAWYPYSRDPARLGLDRVGEPKWNVRHLRQKLDQGKPLVVPMREVLIDYPDDSLSGLRAFIEERYGCPGDGEAYVLLPSTKIFAELPRIERMLGGSRFSERVFLEALSADTWRESLRSPWPSVQRRTMRVVIHVRLGDRLALDVGDRIVCLHADQVFVLPKERPAQDEVWLPDRDNLRSLTTMVEVSALLVNLRSSGLPLRVTLLSDGLSLTQKRLRRHAESLCREHGLDRASVEMAQRKVRGELQDLCGRVDRAVVGESRGNFWRSIHAVQEADAIVYTGGGFARDTGANFQTVHRPKLILPLHTEDLMQQLAEHVARGAMPVGQPSVA